MMSTLINAATNAIKKTPQWSAYAVFCIFLSKVISCVQMLLVLTIQVEKKQTLVVFTNKRQHQLFSP